ncbi:hypothetical protein DM01DRAFT_1130904 [Hesseltinella vesiculosa]|uniref:SAM domain-containing protein n=1 Tax=Hesseltinella vesiculosa TaxID=101127 RepID=A0A1X2G919_9FUNG|nr:hypothetical protein DM01DRAFT_1130904 [Hesseltinella vesiculosa]
MMLMLNELIILGVESPVVCGMWVNGFHCELLKMDLPGNGINRLVEIDELELPKSIDDLVKVGLTAQKLLKMKRYIDATTNDAQQCIKKLKLPLCSTSDTSSSFNKKRWTRSPLEGKRVKKIKTGNKIHS